MSYPKISFECPIGLLNHVTPHNDYLYCTLPFLTEYDDYVSFMKNNSYCKSLMLNHASNDMLFWDEYYRWIEYMNPDEYFVPDISNDSLNTIKAIEKWNKKFSDISSKTIGVVQGKTLKDMEECYLKIKNLVDKIAFPCTSIAYKNMPMEYYHNLWHKKAVARNYLITKLIGDGKWDYSKPHHLCGCSFPIEFKNYKWKEMNIESLETSNPVNQALLGNEYSDTLGLEDRYYQIHKGQFQRIFFTQEDENLVDSNCLKFRRTCTV